MGRGTDFLLWFLAVRRSNLFLLDFPGLWWKRAWTAWKVLSGPFWTMQQRIWKRQWKILSRANLLTPGASPKGWLRSSTIPPWRCYPCSHPCLNTSASISLEKIWYVCKSGPYELAFELASSGSSQHASACRCFFFFIIEQHRWVYKLEKPSI